MVPAWLPPAEEKLVQAMCDAESALTVIEAEPVTVGDVAEAVRAFDPALNNAVPDSAVVLTPLVNETDEAG